MCVFFSFLFFIIPLHSLIRPSLNCAVILSSSLCNVLKCQGRGSVSQLQLNTTTVGQLFKLFIFSHVYPLIYNVNIPQLYFVSWLYISVSFLCCFCAKLLGCFFFFSVIWQIYSGFFFKTELIQDFHPSWTSAPACAAVDGMWGLTGGSREGLGVRLR